MTTKPSVILSGFADEAANQKTAEQQFSAFAALGLQYFTIRFVDAGNGVKNVMDLSKSEISKLRHLAGEYGLNVSSIGSPIGKVKLLDVDDGTENRYVPFDQYLAKDVKKVCEMAHAFETKLIRGFSFYHPLGTDPQEHVPQVVDQLGQIAEVCHRSDLTFGLEIEANLVGQTGELLAEIHRRVNHPALMLHLRRRQCRRAGLLARRSVPTISGHERRARLDAHQGLPTSQTGPAHRTCRRRGTQTLRAGRLGR